MKLKGIVFRIIFVECLPNCFRRQREKKPSTFDAHSFPHFPLIGSPFLPIAFFLAFFASLGKVTCEDRLGTESAHPERLFFPPPSSGRNKLGWHKEIISFVGVFFSSPCQENKYSRTPLYRSVY